MSETVIATGLEFPEGPVCERDGTVYFVEIGGGRVRKVVPNGTLSVVAQTGGGPNGLAKLPDGRCMSPTTVALPGITACRSARLLTTKLVVSSISTRTATSNASTLPVTANH